MKLLFTIGVMTVVVVVSISMLILLAQQAQAQVLTDQEQMNKLIQGAKEAEQSLHSLVSQAKACTSMSDSKNKTEAAMDPRVRDCLKKNLGWDDEKIDMMYGIKR